MSAIEAASVGIKTMADGTLRLTVDVEPRNAQAAFALFGSPGTAMALAALKLAAATVEPVLDPEPAPQKEQVGPICYWLALRCKEHRFREWLARESNEPWLSDASAAEIVRRWCGVESRKEIDGDLIAEHQFQTRIRGPYAKHCSALGVTA